MQSRRVIVFRRGIRAVRGAYFFLCERGYAFYRGNVQMRRLSRNFGMKSAVSVTASKNPKYRLFRYGVQVNSLGLTEEQPENNAWRILIEALGVTMSRNARCRALQLPVWNEALSLPRPWDQQWSLRLATDSLLTKQTCSEYPDLLMVHRSLFRKSMN